MFQKLKRDALAQKFFTTAEEASFYEQAASEAANGEIHAGLYAMAVSKCEGDELKAKALYLQLRVEMLQQEAAVSEQLREQERQQEELRQAQTQEVQENPGDTLLLLGMFTFLIAAFWGIALLLTAAL